MHARLLSIAAVTALAIGALASPVAAGAVTTRYVDDDGTAGIKGCVGSLSVPTTIGGGLALSSPGDTVLVCPGKYPELVDISGAGLKGVTVRSTQRWKATVNPLTPADGPIVHVAAANVRVQWLKVVAPTKPGCSQAAQGIVVEGVNGARIVSNLVLAAPQYDTFFTSCGLVEGITVNNGAVGAQVDHNIVRAFKLVGILVHNADARVLDNSVQYWHPQLCAAEVACTSATRTAVRAARRAARLSPAGPASPTGIRSHQSTGVITLNAVTAAPDGQTPSVRLMDGISTQGSSGLKIRNNLVTGGFSGLVLNDSNHLLVEGNVVVGSVPSPTAHTPAAVVAVGVTLFGGDDSTVRSNRVAHFGAGMVAAGGASFNAISGNDFTGNGTDCQEAPSTAGSFALLNTWTDNLGNVDSPTGLCTDAPISPIPGSPT